jgi:hypothetical protein
MRRHKLFFAPVSLPAVVYPQVLLRILPDNGFHLAGHLFSDSDYFIFSLEYSPGK